MRHWVIGPDEWLGASRSRPGRPCIRYVLAEDGIELPPGQAGELVFEGGPSSSTSAIQKTASVPTSGLAQPLGDASATSTTD